MNLKAKYIRTAKGDAALENQTVTGRLSKLVLTVIDGQLTGSDIGDKLGDAANAEKILAQLLKDGLIAQLGTAKTSTRQAREEIEEEEEEDEEPPKKGVGGLLSKFQSGKKNKKAAQEEEDIEEIEEEDEGEDAEEEPKGFFAKLKAKRAQKDKEKEEAEILRSLKGRGKGSRKKVKVKRNRVYRAPRSPFLSGLLYIVGSVVAAAALLFLFPFGIFRASFEQHALATFGAPTTIGNIGFSFTPYPNLTMNNIKVGGKEATIFNVDTVRIVPDVRTILSSNQGISRLELSGVRLNMDQAGEFAKLFPGNPAASRVEKLVLSDVSVNLGDLTSKYSGSGHFESNGKIKYLQLKADDLSMEMTVSPAPDDQGLLLVGNGQSWRVPVAPEVTFDRFGFQATVKDKRMTIQSMDGTSEGGIFQGTGIVDWSTEDVVFSSDVELRRADFAKLLKTINPELKGRGLISLEGKVGAVAKSFSALAQKYEASGKITIAQGSYTSFSLVEALREGKGQYRGGYTDFDEITGTFVVNSGAGFNFPRLQLSSGILSASGSLNYRKGRYYGGMSVRIQSARGMIQAPVNLSGELRDPFVQVIGKP